jgi:hypothetical protein
MSCGLSVIYSEPPSPRVFLLPLLHAILSSTSQRNIKKFTDRISLSTLRAEARRPVFPFPLLLAFMPSTSQRTIKKFTYCISSSILRAEARQIAWGNVVEMWGTKIGFVIDEFHAMQRCVAAAQSKPIYNLTSCSKG